MNMQKFLDSKHGKFIGRVYMLVLLFLFNAFIPIAAVMYYPHSMTPLLLYLGVAGTVACIAVLSTPTKIESNQDS